MLFRSVVIRRRDNQKWFAGIFTITGHKVGLDTNEPMDVVNLKCEPDLIANLIHENRIYPAYHMKDVYKRQGYEEGEDKSCNNNT